MDTLDKLVQNLSQWTNHGGCVHLLLFFISSWFGARRFTLMFCGCWKRMAWSWYACYGTSYYCTSLFGLTMQHFIKILPSIHWLCSFLDSREAETVWETEPNTRPPQCFLSGRGCKFLTHTHTQCKLLFHLGTAFSHHELAPTEKQCGYEKWILMFSKCWIIPVLL